MPNLKVRLLISVFLLISVLFSGCAGLHDLDDQVREASNPYRFHLLAWEFKTLAGEPVKIINRHPADNITSRETQLEQRVREEFSAQGIYNPLDRFFTLKIGFPPVNIYLARPPHLLVISPRDRIQSIRTMTLLPDMAERDMEEVEARIEKLGYSSLVVELGGIATFPSYVSNDADTKYILKTAAEEWMHQYLAFTPLGFLYVLDAAGIRLDYDVATMNETVAGIISQEIGEAVYAKYYAAPPGSPAPEKPTTNGFDFNRTLREIRLAVDSYLALGEIEQAEAFMAQQRQYLADNGYNIRKLNQAYFAFYGTYADSPTSISPIGADMRKLRSESASLKDFLEKASAMTSPEDLADSVR